MYKRPQNRQLYIRMITALIGVVFLVFTGCEGEMVAADTDKTIMDSLFEHQSTDENRNSGEQIRCITGILVDQNGYDTMADKIAVFRGNDLDKKFEVVLVNSNETVFRGEIQEWGTNEATGEYTYIGDFSDLTQQGQYYIKNATVGESYEFLITDNMYEKMCSQLTQSFYLNRCTDTEDSDISGGWYTNSGKEKSVIDGALATSYLLTAYELCPQTFDKDMIETESGSLMPRILQEVTYEMQWLLNMPEETSPDDSLAFAAAAAQFGRMYRKYDSDYADLCLHQAELSYQDAKENATQSYAYLAATQMYKTTGLYDYRMDAESILRSQQLPGYQQFDPAVFLSDIAYLTIPQKTDASLCDIRMQEMMAKAKEVMDVSVKDSYLVCGSQNKTIYDNYRLLEEIQCTAFINCVITNRESRSVLEEQLHFIGGRNAEAKNCYSAEGIIPEIPKDSEQPNQDILANAMLLFVIGVYM